MAKLLAIGSEDKFVLRTFELISGLGAVGTTLCMFRFPESYGQSDLVFLVVFCFCLALAVAFVSFSLWEEYAKVIRGKSYDPRDENSLSLAEFRNLILWSPGAYKLALPIAFLFGFGFFWWLIQAESSAAGTKATNLAFGMMSMANVFMLISLPILASASRMPGSYREHFAHSTPPRK